MFWERFYNLCIKQGEKPLQVVKKLNIATGSITKWKNGTIPNGQNLIVLADYFGVSIDYLVGRSDLKEQKYENYTSRENIYEEILDEENGELKLKLYFMRNGSVESQADSIVSILKYLKEFENKADAFSDTGDVINCKIDWEQLQLEEENRINRILELEKQLKELEK